MHFYQNPTFPRIHKTSIKSSLVAIFFKKHLLKFSDNEKKTSKNPVENPRGLNGLNKIKTTVAFTQMFRKTRPKKKILRFLGEIATITTQIPITTDYEERSTSAF